MSLDSSCAACAGRILLRVEMTRELEAQASVNAALKPWRMELLGHLSRFNKPTPTLVCFLFVGILFAFSAAGTLVAAFFVKEAGPR